MAHNHHTEYGPQQPHDQPRAHPSRAKSWISLGGILGLAILLSRFTRMPLASIFSMLPFLLKQLKAMENTQASQTQHYSRNHTSSMTKEEAALILGVTASASDADIQKAHRNLIQKNHPDQGGNDYLAAKINQARDVLLSKR